MTGAALALILLAQAAVPEHLKGAAELATSGQYAAAAQELARVDAALPGVQHLRGVVFYNLRKYADAAAALKAAIATEKEGTAAYRESALLIGQSEFLLNRYAAAVPWLRKARQAGATSVEVVYMLGMSHVHLLDPAPATAAFADLYGVEPESAAALVLTAQMMFRLEYLPQAEPLLRKALELNARIPGAHQLLGEIATFRNDIDRAVAELTAELAVNPNSAQAYYKLGDAYSRREDWAQAMPSLQKSVWLNPYNSGPYILLGKGYLKQEQYANAEGMLRRALQMDPNNSSAHYMLGQTLLRIGRAEEGRALLKRSQALQSAK